jgi:hypothetical protein
MGSFGPWSPDDPGQTPLAAEYTFDKADLGVFKGISGILSSTGKFGGVLENIEVEGKTSTPDFTVTIGGHPLDLETVFSATVDGTNGDTLLHPVTAHLLNTVIVAQGGVVKSKDNKGKEITLDVTVDKGRLEDLLRLAVKTTRPPLTGAVNFHTKFDLPPGEGDLADRLNLNGKFEVKQAHFTSPEVTAKIETLSRKGQGQPENKDAGSSVSQLKGNFVLDNGVITFRGLTFSVTGAEVALNGKYGLDKEDLDFHGKLRMQAKISQTTTGAKSFVLKAVDPFFRKNGQTVLPIKITGQRDHPSFGLDLHRKDKDDKEKDKGE